MVSTADKSNVLEAFKKFDADGNSLIKQSEFQSILQRIDAETWTDERVADVFQAADCNNDGMINFQEFIDWLWNDPAAQEQMDCVGPMICGGFGEKQPANEEVQAIAEQVKDAALEKASMALMEGAEWKAVQYSSQVVAGTNYDIDVDTGNSGFVNIKVYVDLEGNTELADAQCMPTLDPPVLIVEEPIICCGPMICGGFTEKQPASEEVQAVADRVKDAAVEKANMLLLEDAEWKAVQYSSQVVAGTNYDIDVDTGNSGFVNIQVYVDLEGNTELTDAVYMSTLGLAVAEDAAPVEEVPELAVCPGPIEELEPVALEAVEPES